MGWKQKITRSGRLIKALGLFKEDSCATQTVLAPQDCLDKTVSDVRQPDVERARSLGTIYYYSLHDTRTR